MPRPSATAFSTALLPKLSQCMADDGPRNITKSLWLSLSTSVEDAASRERSLLASWGSDKPSVPASHRLAGLEWMDPDRDGAPNPRHRSPFVGTTSSWRRPRVRPSVRRVSPETELVPADSKRDWLWNRKRDDDAGINRCQWTEIHFYPLNPLRTRHIRQQPFILQDTQRQR